MKRVLWIDKGDATFIRSDLDLLAEHARIRRISFRYRGVRAGLWLMFRMLTLWWNVAWSDVVIVQFGGWHGLPALFWARLLGRRSLLFLHGADCVAIPSIHYGNFSSPGQAWATRRCYRWASVLVPMHESLIERDDPFNDGEVHQQGIHVRDPRCRTPINVLHHGFDPGKWPLGRGERSGFITVALDAFAPRTHVLKGIDLVIAAAREMPEVPFTIIGASVPGMHALPKNLSVLPPMPQAELAHHYAGALGYLQLSLSEGFGCAMAEAMLCGCVPIVSAAGSLPDVSSGMGPVVRERSAQAVVDAVRAVLGGKEYASGIPPRTAIMERFPLSLRASLLIGLISGTKEEGYFAF
ncbi:MAG: glycosyltransferase [Flavobacteriales bacterium]|nr:glycosyltransferase [Flavobacteriales bacterium]